MPITNIVERFLRPVTEPLTPESDRKLAELQTGPAAQIYIDNLAEKSSRGTIKPEDDTEYKALIDAADLIGILKLKARQYLQNLPA